MCVNICKGVMFLKKSHRATLADLWLVNLQIIYTPADQTVLRSF